MTVLKAHGKRPLKIFVKMDKEILKTVDNFCLPYDTKNEGVNWKILRDGDDVDYCTFDLVTPDIDIDLTESISHNFLLTFFHRLKVTGKY